MKISHAKPLSDYRLELTFASGEHGIVDLSAYVGRGVFTIWNSPGIFERVRVTSEGALEWPGEVDLCPDSLYLRMTGKSPDELFPILNLPVTHA
jgi:hypothetical protein